MENKGLVYPTYYEDTIMHKYFSISLALLSLFVSACATKPATQVSTALPPAASMSTSATAETPSQPHYGANDIDSEATTDHRAKASETAEPAFETIYFDYDSYLLSEAAKASLLKAADIFRQRPELKATIAGYCDDRGSEMYNIALGEKRARSILNYLENLGIKAERLEIVSFGEENPAVIGFDEKSRSLNRRGTFM